MSFQLNEQQNKAVYYEGLKPLLIQAGAGSGKTRVMTERVRYLLERGENPESILICTFSTKAADELKDRLIDYALDENSPIQKTDINKMQISTVHSFCMTLLKVLGYNFDVYDDGYSEKRLLFIYNHKDELGFVDEAYLSRGQIVDVAKKFSDYIEFNVREEEFRKYLEENFPIDESYLELFNSEEYDGKFPYDLIKKDKELRKQEEKEGIVDMKSKGYNDSWYNARFLQTIKAFPIYKKLLSDCNATDYAFMQAKALEMLKKDPQTKYKNILVDEFQDTDPIQIQIFEILMEEALKDNSPGNIKGTFTAVGDMNQNIYGFRGASFNYFKQLDEKRPCENLSLNVNHRSTNQIVKLTERFINSNNEDSDIHLSAAKNLNRDCYYIKSETKEDEARNLVDIINHLVETGKAEYKDILVLFRSVSYGAPKFIAELEGKIPYNARGIGDLTSNDLIKSVISFIDFIVQIDDGGVPIYSENWAWLSPKAFTGAEFDQKLVNLSDETKEILNKVQDDYEAKVVEVGLAVQENFDCSKRKKFNTMFKHDNDVLEAIFANPEVKKPVLTNEFLKEVGVTNKEDLAFFERLNKLKDEFFEKDYVDRETICEVYYKLLDISGYLTEEFILDPENKEDLDNLALLTNTICNYEDIVSSSDIRGLYWFLRSNIKNYSPISLNNGGVQIMTVHEAKGLEFPVTILASLQAERFPRKYTDDAEEPTYRRPYYTPNRFLEYKPPHEEEESKHYDEENRVIYVAMTRAEDTLILSNIAANKGEVELPPSIEELIKNNSDIIKPLNMNNLDIIEKMESSKELEEDEKLTLSYSSIDTYEACPMSYHLRNNLNFRISSSDEMNYGNVVHNTLEVLNNANKECKEFTREEIILLILETFDKYPDLENDAFKKQKTIEDILYYWDNFGKNLKVLEAEYPFSIFDKDYKLSGAIDLLYETEDGNLGILDYKNAYRIDDFKKNKYSKQIYTYISALSEDPVYHNRKVTEAKVYATSGRKVIPIVLSDEINIDFIKEAADDIKSGIFESKINIHCDWCPFNFICLEARCPECGLPMRDGELLCYKCNRED